jgi:UPF0755 protein
MRMNDRQDFENERQKKIQNFHIHIDDDEIDDDSVIHSYSDPAEAEKLHERINDRAQMAHQLRDAEKAKKNRSFFRMMWFCFVMIFSLLAGKYLVFGVNDMLAVGRDAVNVTIEVPKNATSSEVAQLLYKAGAINDMTFFKLYSKLTKAPSTYSGGSYQITTNMDYEALINSIQSPTKRVDTVKITFSEGLNALEIADKLEKNGVCSAEDALKAFNTTELDSDYDMLAEIPKNSDKYYRLEGYLFPDTYEFFKNDDPINVVKKMVSNCNRKLTKQIREKAASENLTIDQMLTLASLIQAEAATTEDMYDISAVFHNRLKSKDPALKHLGSDPTVFYPYRTKKQVPASLGENYQSKYDTYNVVGLPAGAICNPGSDAIDAALNPSESSYYYFCYDKKNKLYLAKTLSQHQANLKKAGIK